MPTDPVAIARDLIRCRSVTPDEGGALAYLQGLLTPAGFEVFLDRQRAAQAAGYPALA